MSCLVTASTALEIAPFIDHIKSKTGRIPVDILVSGVGSMATIYSLGKQISIKRPSLMIQAGVAGCFDRSWELGTVVAVKQDVNADLGVIENNKLKSVFDLGLADANSFPYQKGWLKNPGAALLKKTKLREVKGVSVNQITTSATMKRLMREKFDPVTESLEGAAFHYVGIMEKIPFLQIRSLSNYVGERDKKKWRLKESILKLNQALIHLLDVL